MSGPICPDCGTFEIKRGSPSGASCTLCGWSGERLSNKALDPEDQRKKAASNRAKIERRKSGQLFFLRVFMPEQYEEKVTDAVMKLLDLKSISLNGGGYLYVELSERPSEEVLRKLESIRHVTKVTLT